MQICDIKDFNILEYHNAGTSRKNKRVNRM